MEKKKNKREKTDCAQGQIGSPYIVPQCKWPSHATVVTYRAVKKVLSSRLIMNSRRLWNSHQRHKFLRAEASGNILKFRVSEMAFAGVFKRYFHRGRHVVSSEFTKD